MANRKNNQNENPSADTQAVTTNDGGQENDATAQPVDAQQEATEPPKGEDVPQGNSGTDGDTTNSDENPPSAADKQDGTDDTPSADRKGNANGEASAKSVKMTLRHKSHTPRYHRCGLTLTKAFAEYDVPEECVERVKSDKWIEVKGAK